MKRATLMRLLKQAGALVVLASAALQPAPARAALNPAAVYCRALGYEYVVAQTPRGERGLCRLPGERLVDGWEFYAGRVATDVNYCGLQGLPTRYVEIGPLCKNCAVCVQPDGSEVPVAQAMNLSFRESTCGDGKCGTAEDHLDCPADCPSGGYDEVCDGLGDGVCDRDCQEQQLADPDCQAPPGGGDGCGCGANPGGPSGALLGLLALGALVGRRRFLAR